MLRRVLGLVVVLAAVVVAGCGAARDQAAREPAGNAEDAPPGAVVGRGPATQSPHARTVADGLNRFAFDFYRVLAERSSGENVVFSPLSIGIAFGMADAGARSETAAQIEDVFHLPGSGRDLHAAFGALDRALVSERKHRIVRLANRLYPDVGFDVLPNFTETLDGFYGAPVERLDFAADPEGARERINAWVADRTEGRIRELLDSGTITPETVLVLVNALYLEAKWSQPFGKYPTAKQPFKRLDGTTVDVPLMRNAELRTRYAEAKGYQAVDLPYGDGALSMLVVVPPAGKLEELEGGFDSDLLAEIDARMTEDVVDLSLPRWSTTYEIDLDETLPELGLTLPFEPDAADFTGISPYKPYIAAGVHAADIEVDEKGTVAAAATARGFELSALTAETVVRADRPFLYLIRHRETGSILFLGRVTDPSP